LVVYWILIIALFICAFQAINAKRLIVSALWLAGTSALVALIMYQMGAIQLAVIELSVGAGLVTVLFVFAINITGDQALSAQSIVPRPIAWGIVLLSVFLLGWLTLPSLPVDIPGFQPIPLATLLWQNRALDALLQIVLIFTGILGVLGILSEEPSPHKKIEEQK
jgi:uncharacterized MnhB-related membrane protein